MDDKPLSEWNAFEIRGFVVDRMSKVEELLNVALTIEVNPKNEGWFRRYILNSSVMSLLGKIQVARNSVMISEKVAGRIDSLRSKRNWFAHLIFQPIYGVQWDGGPSPELKNISKHVFQYLNSEGKIKSKVVFEEFKEFYSLSNSVIDDLKAIVPRRYVYWED